MSEKMFPIMTGDGFGIVLILVVTFLVIREALL